MLAHLSHAETRIAPQQAAATLRNAGFPEARFIPLRVSGGAYFVPRTFLINRTTGS